MTWLLCLFCGSWSRVEVQVYHITRSVYGSCSRAECRCQVLSMLVVAEKAEIASAAVTGPHLIAMNQDGQDVQDLGPIPTWAREAFDGG